jgi:hypothetical protein
MNSPDPEIQPLPPIDGRPLEFDRFRINPDPAHGPWPAHYDIVTQFNGGAHKLRVDADGNILSDQVNISPRVNW